MAPGGLTFKSLAVFTASSFALVTFLINRPSHYTDLVQLPYQKDAVEDYKGFKDYKGAGDMVMADRRARLRDVCLAHAGHGVLKPMSPYFATRFWPASMTLAEEEAIAWCRVGKVATTAWSALFLLMRDVPVPEVRAAILNLTAHDLLKQHYPSRPSERMHKVKGEHGKDYFSFMVVRHPFVRIVSAYRDKLETLKEYNVKYHMKDGPRMTSRRVFNSSVSDNPTFPEFVNYLIRTPPNLMDKHWAPYSKVCMPCNISYNAILKLETLAQDADWLFDKLDLNQLKEDWADVSGVEVTRVKAELESIVGKQTAHHGGSSQDLANEYFSQVPKSEIVRLYQKYKVDFQMFDYEAMVDKFVQMGY